jgi:mannose-6-phosphate isomerase-like protein (cupin superfamily)
MQQKPISLKAACAALPEIWLPRVLGQVNNQYIKVARVEGDFPWPTHDAEDEMFLVLRGRLRIGRAPEHGGPIDVSAGEFFVVRAGVPHDTSAAEETWLALIETTTTLNTGSELLPQTRSIEQQLR